MPKAKNLHSLEGARRRPKKPNSEQSSQVPSSGLNLLQALNACQDAELLSRIEYCQRLAQEVDEHYEYKLFVGEGKQAQKRCAEYMRIQHEISEKLYEDIEELMRRVRLRNDILLLTQMETASAKIAAGRAKETPWLAGLSSWLWLPPTTGRHGVGVPDRGN